MPPRSRQTRTHPNDPLRAARSILDLDPTDGLPVQKWSLQLTRLNQDLSATDQTTNNPRSTTSAEWAAQFNTPAYPWPEQPLPSFIKELPAWNQELIRRARCGQTNVKLSEWDRRAKCWISAADADRRHQWSGTTFEPMNGAKQEGEDVETGKSDDSDMHGSDEDDADKSDASASDLDNEESPFKPSLKRRKHNNLADSPEEVRTIDVKKWVLLPPAVADTHPEPSFLAPRRSGMPPLYRSELTAKLFSQYDSSNYIQSGMAGYDLGEGGGLANASAVTGAVPQVTPSRRNAPPRRKKKKLGGPGRRKIIRDPLPEQATTGDTNTSTTTPAEDTPSASAMIPGITTEPIDHDDEALSGSDNEGSEEGEIDEGPNSPNPPKPAIESTAPSTTSNDITGNEPPAAPTAAIPSTDEAVPESSAPTSAPPETNSLGDVDEGGPGKIDDPELNNPTETVNEVNEIPEVDDTVGDATMTEETEAAPTQALNSTEDDLLDRLEKGLAD